MQQTHIPDENKKAEAEINLYEPMPDDSDLPPRIRPKQQELFLPGVDIEDGIMHCGGELSLYVEVLKLFYTSGLEQYAVIERSLSNGDYNRLGIEAHALKSAASGIGAAGLSKYALALELACKTGQLGSTLSADEREGIPELGRALLSEFMKMLKTVEPYASEEEELVPDMEIPHEFILSSLIEAKKAAENYDLDRAAELMKYLKRHVLNDDLLGGVEGVLEHCSHFSYSGTVELLSELIEEETDKGGN